MTEYDRGLARQVLDLPMGDRFPTVREYLIGLLSDLWEKGADFNSKRPFGMSSWESDLYIPLIHAGLIRGAFDEDDCLADCDDRAGDQLIANAIRELGATS
jgi:hypothetical protein